MRDGEDFQTNVWRLAHGWYQGQNIRMPLGCWDFSSWNVTCPGCATLISKGSCGHCMENFGSTHALHDGRPGSRHPEVPLDNHYRIHLETNFSFRTLFPGTDRSFKMPFALPGVQQRCKGKHALLHAEGGQQDKELFSSFTSMSELITGNKSSRLRWFPGRVSNKPTHPCSHQRADTHQDWRAIGCHGSVHGWFYHPYQLQQHLGPISENTGIF